MIKEALQYLSNMAKSEVEKIDGQFFHKTAEDINRLEFDLPDSIELSSLDSLVEIALEMKDSATMIIIKSPTRVQISSPRAIGGVTKIIKFAEASINHEFFEFDRFTEQEKFLIGLQSKFKENGNLIKLLKLASAMDLTEGASLDDDGVSQKVQVRSGVAFKSVEKVQNPILLRPYRTFMEIEQPESPYIFRAKKGSSGLLGLFQAEGNIWEFQAKKAIKEYLEKTSPIPVLI